jgi:hypothetical protein
MEGAQVELAAGWHPLDLTYRRQSEDPGIRLLWREPGTAGLTPVPRSSLAPSSLAVRGRLPRTLSGIAALGALVALSAWLWHRRTLPGSLGGFVLARRHEAALAGILVLGFLLRAHGYASLPFHHETADEYQHGWEGWSLLHEGEPSAWTFYPQRYPAGQVVPLRWFGDAYYVARPYFDHPPGFSLIVGTACTLLGAEQMLDCTLWRMRPVPILFSLIALYLVARVGWKFFPDKLPGTLAALLLATLPTVVLGNRLVKAENLLAPLLLAQTLWLQQYLEKGKRGTLWKIAVVGGISIWAKATGIATPIAACLVLARARAWKALGTVAGVAAAATALYLLYGAWFGWSLFVDVLGQQASKWVALRTLVDLSAISRVVGLQFGGGWYLWLAMAAAWMALSRFRELLTPAAIYLVVLALTADSRAVFGWYRLPLYPFLCLAGGLFLAEWWKEKDLARGLLFGITALATTLIYSLPEPQGPSRPIVLVLLLLTTAGPLWFLIHPSAAAGRARAAGVLAALVLFFAGNLTIIAHQVPTYLREATAGKTPDVSATPPANGP